MGGPALANSAPTSHAKSNRLTSAIKTSAQPGHIVYLSYGQGPHVAQVHFSALSAMRFAAARGGDDLPPMVVFTNRPEDYEQLGIDVVGFSDEQLAAWRGPHDFNHVVKLEVLRLALERLGSACALVDGDSYFRRHPRHLLNRIGPGSAVMHLRETRLRSLPVPGLRPVIASIEAAPFLDRQGAAIRLEANFDLWNAGVIGLHPADANLLDDAISFSHQLYERSQSPLSEEFAVSYVLTRHTRVRGSSDVVYHYWPYLRDWDPPHRPTEWALRVPQLLSATAELPPPERGAALFTQAYRLPFWGRHGRLYWYARPVFERLRRFDPDVRRSV